MLRRWRNSRAPGRIVNLPSTWVSFKSSVASQWLRPEMPGCCIAPAHHATVAVAVSPVTRGAREKKRDSQARSSARPFFIPAQPEKRARNDTDTHVYPIRAFARREALYAALSNTAIYKRALPHSLCRVSFPSCNAFRDATLFHSRRAEILV